MPDLIKAGKKVTVYDTMYFSDQYLPKESQNLKVIKGDIRDKNKLEKNVNHDVFINLACISNDTSFQLDEKLSTSNNLTLSQWY